MELKSLMLYSQDILIIYNIFFEDLRCRIFRKVDVRYEIFLAVPYYYDLYIFG